MSLLPGGENGSRSFQVCFAVAIVFAGYQAFVNLHRYQAVSGNLVSLGDEINLRGEDAFRERLVSILEINGVQMTPEEIAVSLDKGRNAYLVSAPCRWTLDLPWRTVGTQTTLRALIPRKAYLPSE